MIPLIEPVVVPQLAAVFITALVSATGDGWIVAVTVTGAPIQLLAVGVIR